MFIIGLGNPGTKYQNTRHNAGFMALDALALRLGLEFALEKKSQAQIARSNDLVLIKPESFMNNSGVVVQRILSYYKAMPRGIFGTKKNTDLADSLTVIHDEMDIELGKYKISVDSRSAGHNGVTSIIQHLKTQKFRRIRLGIKTEEAKKIPTEKFVLGRFSDKERKIMEGVIQSAINELQ